MRHRQLGRAYQPDESTPEFATFTVAERWNGSKWALMNTPSPDPGNENNPIVFLTSVACLTAAKCFAMGQQNNAQVGDVPGLLALNWNGSAWCTPILVTAATLATF